MKLITDVVSYTYKEMPKWNPTNVCSYHLQEAGATPVQELSFALATAIAVLDAVQESGQIGANDFAAATGRISFFVNAGIRFITEMCKMRAFVDLWDEILQERYGVTEEKFRRFRYGVQVNSLGLTEQQPENNVYRILLEMLAVVLSKNARARAVQLPAWNEALGLPRPWDQQWSLRLQQIVAFETDLLEFGDIFEGSIEIDRKVEELKTAAREELRLIEDMGGAVAAVDTGYLKECLVQSNTKRVQSVISGELPVVGVNRFTESAPSPLTREGDGSIMTVDPAAESEQLERLNSWREARDDGAVKRALEALSAAANSGDNIMPASIQAAKAGVTTGEWSEALRKTYGEYRAPTGVSSSVSNAGSAFLDPAREKVAAAARELGMPLKVLIGKPGLDGHSNGAEQIAVAARDSGMQVVYDGIRLTPDQIVKAALDGSVHIVGLSILSGSHISLATEVCEKLKAAGAQDIPVVVGGIIPPEDAEKLKAAGVTAIYTPKDFDMAGIIIDMVDIIMKYEDVA
ncbi:MAG: protein meaA [Sneathiella sp.]|nr:MAG: protein meaA [Sneathiella sp.]